MSVVPLETRSELQAELQRARRDRNGSTPQQRAVDGATFILDAPTTIPAIWGRGDEVLWAGGEPLLMVGPPGVGKTTIAQRLTLRRVGLGDEDNEVLGLPVAVGARRTLYIAADRPAQAARSFARMVGATDADKLRECLVVWKGPLPFDLGRVEPDRLLAFVTEYEVDTLVVDSLKDVAVGLADDERAGRLNLALQQLVAADIEVLALHHQRKATAENRRPNKLDDVYGSAWLTAGAGSVVLLWGQAGDPIIDLRHIKQPAGEVGPITLTHDAKRGDVAVHDGTDLYQLVQLASSDGGLTARDAARHLYGAEEPDRNQKEKARRRLDELAEKERIAKRGGSRTEPARYLPIDQRSTA